MHNILGFCTLKAQKDHYDEFVFGKILPVSQTPAAMVHGTAHEVQHSWISFIYLLYKPHTESLLIIGVMSGCSGSTDNYDHKSVIYMHRMCVFGSEIFCKMVVWT